MSFLCVTYSCEAYIVVSALQGHKPARSMLRHLSQASIVPIGADGQPDPRSQGVKPSFRNQDSLRNQRVHAGIQALSLPGTITITTGIVCVFN
jgi:hypothetical protein